MREVRLKLQRNVAGVGMILFISPVHDSLYRRDLCDPQAIVQDSSMLVQKPSDKSAEATLHLCASAPYMAIPIKSPAQHLQPHMPILLVPWRRWRIHLRPH
jgi:hypothetical protein